MTERQQAHQVHLRKGGMLPIRPSKGPSPRKALALITLLPVGGCLLGLAGLTLIGSLIGLAITTPQFIIFSPILMPAAILIGLTVTAFITSGAFGLTGLSSLYRVMNSMRQATSSMQDVGSYMGQKTKEMGQTIQNKAHEAGGEGSRTRRT